MTMPAPPYLVYDLGRPLEPSMPISPNHPGYRMALLRRHGDVERADGGSAANELIVMGGHTGTHLDGLAHVSRNGRLHGGLDAHQAQRGGSFSVLGMETVAPMVCRGLLLDVAAHRGLSTVPAGDGIGADELRAVASAQGTEPGDAGALLIRTGWGRHWDDPQSYLGHDSGVPGIDESGAAWLASIAPRVCGSDSMAFERIQPGGGHALLPVHSALLVDHGIHIIENLDLERLAADRRYEFLFVCLPLPLVGATGSPVRPVAILFE